MRFKNKVVLVTGAGRNTGLGIAARFAAEGATVFLNGRTTEKVGTALAALRQRGLRRLIGLVGDISVAPQSRGDVPSNLREGQTPGCAGEQRGASGRWR